MKNKLIIFLFFILFQSFSHADNLDIKAKNIKIEKINEITVFENEVEVIDKFNNIINADYVEYNKKNNFLKLEGNIYSKDKDGNIFSGSKATYDNNNQVFKSIGDTKFETVEGYKIVSSNITIDNTVSKISTDSKTIITDLDNNKIFLDNFEYLKQNNIFKSVGEIEIIDKNKNSYNFSQVFIDEKKKEIIGSDAKFYINQDNLKFNKKNKPRVFSNTINIKEDETMFVKSNFTMCNYREKDKCPPWELKAREMRHDKIKKTIFYENAVLRLYDVPIFYFPKLAHPDPTVKRRSGFLIPSYSDTKNLGSSVAIPYFWAIDIDKDLTINNKLFATEHPLFLGEYRQAYKNSNLVFDFGYTEGYKKTTSKKKAGDKSHFFSNFLKNFETSDNITSEIEVNLEHVSNKKYLKLYKIESNLIDYETSVLENYINYNSENDERDSFLSLSISNFRSLADKYNDKYEYILPEITYDKQIFGESLGYGNLKSNIKVHNFDTNKYKKFFTNEFDWNIDNPFSEKFFDGKILTKFKNINYEVQNVNEFKSETTNELFGALGYLASINLYKNDYNGSYHSLTPKVLFKYAPNYMRKETDSFNLIGKNIYSLDRIQSNENFEGGSNMTIGLNYEIENNLNKTNFSVSQIINEKKNNKKMSDTSSLDKRFSDIIGNFNYKVDDRFSINYDVLLDQNYKETNLNDIAIKYATNNFNFNLNYLEEDKKSGENEYFKSSIEYKKGDNAIFTFANKRNLITDSSEFYDLSYEYLNDCLRAGLFYRREFYNDSEIEAENSLMFKITISSFGTVNSPSLSN